MPDTGAKDLTHGISFNPCNKLLEKSDLIPIYRKEILGLERLGAPLFRVTQFVVDQDWV